MSVDESATRELEEAIRLCKRHDPYSLAMMIGAFYIFNGEAFSYVPSHFAVNFAVVNSSSAGGRKADAQSTLRTLESLKNAYEKVVPPFSEPLVSGGLPKDATPAEVRESFNEMAILGAGCCTIRNPGSVGQMVNFGLDKFYPIDDLLQRVLGFKSVEAFRTVRMLQKRMEGRALDGLSDETLSRFRMLHSGVQSTMLIPPKDFLTSQLTACTVTKEDFGLFEKLFGGSLRKFVHYLSADINEARTEGGFLHRWCFFRPPDGNYLLPLPIYLMETLVTAIHVGILEGLSEHEKGEYGLQVGRIFEDIVANRFSQYLPKSKVTPRHAVRAEGRPEDISDVDVLVELPDGGILLVLCRAKGLKYRTRWGNKDNLEWDLGKNLYDQAAQLARILEASPGLLPRTRACFVVTEAYFPAISGFLRGKSSTGSAFRNLPNPFVLSLYDLELMMSYIHPGEFSDYLGWHNEALNHPELLVTDESDFVALYHQKRDDPNFFSELKSKPVFTWTDDYWQFDMETLNAVDRRLGIPPD